MTLFAPLVLAHEIYELLDEQRSLVAELDDLTSIIHEF
jgi:hypothetical protein